MSLRTSPQAGVAIRQFQVRQAEKASHFTIPAIPEAVRAFQNDGKSVIPATSIKPKEAKEI